MDNRSVIGNVLEFDQFLILLGICNKGSAKTTEINKSYIFALLQWNLHIRIRVPL